MQDFIKMATAQLGVSEETGNSATKGLLGMLQTKMGGDDFGALTSALPGAAAMLGGGAPVAPPPAAPAAGGFGGLGGGLGGMLGGALGGGAAPAAPAAPAAGGLGGMLGGMLGDAGGLGAIMQLASSGLGKEQAGPFVQLFLNYVKDKAGPGMVEKIMAAAPQLMKLVG